MSLKRIRVSGAPNPTPKVCGKRPNIADVDKWNPMVPCTLKPRHAGPHRWQPIGR